MNKKKWRDVKNALVMVVVMAAMMSTATYAWFTLSETAGVTGMRMAASGGSGLKVSLDGITWLDAVDLRDALLNEDATELKSINQLTVNGTETDNANKTGDIDTMYPVEFYTPNYENERVTSTTKIENLEEVENHAAVYKFWIKGETETTDVALQLGTQGDMTAEQLEDVLGIDDADGLMKTDGSFLVNVDGIDGGYWAKNAVRIGFVAANDNGQMIIWEPNADSHNNSSDDNKDDLTGEIYTASIQTTASGTVKDSADTTTPALFEVNATEGVEITMYVWLEGRDVDCVDGIRADQLAGQLEFIAVEEP